MLLSMHSVGSYQGNKLTCNSSGNTRLQSSQLVEPLCSDPDGPLLLPTLIGLDSATLVAPVVFATVVSDSNFLK